MSTITTYRISPNILGLTRWQAEVEPSHPAGLLCRRSLTRGGAWRKMQRDYSALTDGRVGPIQRLRRPLLPLTRLHDRLARKVWAS